MAVLGDFAEVCGPAHVRPAEPGDAPGGDASGVVVAPGAVEEVSAVLRLAADRGLAVLPRGNGTKLDWGIPPSTVDVVLDVGRLSGRHGGDDDLETATFGAGTPLREIDAMLLPTGQRLALDPPSRAAGGTLGGVIATAETGPLRHLAGPVTDLVLDIEYVDADGEVRRVVEDEAAALCGSLGTLGVITSAAMRLEPRPPATAWVRRSVRHPAELYDLVLLLDTTPLSVAAIEADWPAVDPVLARVPRPRPALESDAGEAVARPPGPGAFAVQIEGTEAGVADRVRTAVTLLGGDAVALRQPPPWWGRDPVPPGDVALRLTAPPAALHAVGYALRDATVGAASLRGAMGAGMIIAGVPGGLSAQQVVGVVETVRYTLVARDGRCTVLRAPAEVYAAQLGSDPGGAAAREAKERFDPAGRFSPGRLPLSDAG